MDKDKLRQLFNWYYSPGEVLRSIGFYINPQNQWEYAKFRHIFAFDANYNLYIGQYSVYEIHMDKIFDLDDKREYGILYPKDCSLRLTYSDIEREIHGIDLPGETIQNHAPVAVFEFLETKNINYLNLRLRHMAQRLFDYGMPLETVFVSTQVDLWQPTIQTITKGKLMKRPDERWIVNQLIT